MYKFVDHKSFQYLLRVSVISDILEDNIYSCKKITENAEHIGHIKCICDPWMCTLFVVSSDRTDAHRKNVIHSSNSKLDKM